MAIQFTFPEIIALVLLSVEFVVLIIFLLAIYWRNDKTKPFRYMIAEKKPGRDRFMSVIVQILLILLTMIYTACKILAQRAGIVSDAACGGVIKFSAVIFMFMSLTLSVFLIMRMNTTFVYVHSKLAIYLRYFVFVMNFLYIPIAIWLAVEVSGVVISLPSPDKKTVLKQCAPTNYLVPMMCRGIMDLILNIGYFAVFLLPLLELNQNGTAKVDYTKVVRRNLVSCVVACTGVLVLHMTAVFTLVAAQSWSATVLNGVIPCGALMIVAGAMYCCGPAWKFHLKVGTFLVYSSERSVQDNESKEGDKVELNPAPGSSDGAGTTLT